MRHRMHIGTIVSDAMLKVKMLSGGYVGMIEEYFISRLRRAMCLRLAGRTLELVGIKDMTVLTKKSTLKKVYGTKLEWRQDAAVGKPGR